MNQNFIIGVYADSVQSAINAELGGANIIYLCNNLPAGGTTPNAGLIKQARKHTNIELDVMIRPRTGDFMYSDLEFQTMKHDIQLAREYGADGVTFGILRADGTVDSERMEELIGLAKPMNITFSRAFDMASRQSDTLENIINLKVNRLLTSGQEFTALEGADLIKHLVVIAGNRIQILSTGGINERNIKKIVSLTGVKGCLVSFRRAIHGNMTYRNQNINISDTIQLPDYESSVADPLRIKNLRMQI